MNKYLWITYIESVFLCFTYTESVLSKLGATKYAPAGAFFPAEIHLLFSTNREPLFLCFRYIKYALSKLCASGCAPAGAFFPPKKPSKFYK